MAISASRRDSEKERGTGTSWMVSSRCRAVSSPRCLARKATPNPSGAPMRTVPETSSPSPASVERAAIMSASMRSAISRKRSPAGVSSLPVVRRRKSFVRNASSSAVMRRETVAWFSSSLLAAPRNCPERATARKMRTSSQFMGLTIRSNFAPNNIPCL